MKVFQSVLLLSLCITGVYAKPPIIYDNAKLLDLHVDSKQYIRYETEEKAELSTDPKAKDSKIITKTTRPVFVEDNTYYFVIRHDGKIYESYFVPSWKTRIDTNWILGDLVAIKFNRSMNRLYIQKPSGSFLKTKIYRVTRA